MNNITSSLAKNGTLAAAIERMHEVFGRPLRITVNERELHFRRLRDFAFCVAPRVAVPPKRINDLFLRPAAELESEAATLKTLERQLGGILEDDWQHGIASTATLAKLGVRMFSKDHDWRALFEQLIQAPGVRDAYTRIALSTYCRYLGARQEVIRIVLDLERGRPHASADATVFSPDKSTIVFDANDPQNGPADPGLRRLPQGKAVLVRLEDGKEIAIQLAKYPFSLSHDKDWALCAGDGRRYTLRAGVNSVGRGRDNDISVGAELRRVSRKHLLAEPMGPDGIVLTDVSSCGTYIPPTAIAS
jgi:hypothetical protein